MANWAAEGLWCPLGRPEPLLGIRHGAGNEGAAQSDQTLEKENVEKAAIILLPNTFFVLYQTLHKHLKICPRTCKYGKAGKCHCLIHLKEMQHRRCKLKCHFGDSLFLINKSFIHLTQLVSSFHDNYSFRSLI